MSISASINFVGNYELLELVHCIEEYLGIKMKLDEEFTKEYNTAYYRGVSTGIFWLCTKQYHEDDINLPFSEYKYIVLLYDNRASWPGHINDLEGFMCKTALEVARYCCDKLKDKAMVLGDSFVRLGIIDCREGHECR